MNLRRVLLGALLASTALSAIAFAVNNPPLSTNYVVPVPSPSNLVGITATTTPGANAASLVIKAGPGNLYSAVVTNASATAGKLMIVNSTAAPAFGAVTNVLDCVALPASGTASISFNPAPPETFSVGITAMITSNASCYVFDQTTAAITGFIKGSAL